MHTGFCADFLYGQAVQAVMVGRSYRNCKYIYDNWLYDEFCI